MPTVIMVDVSLSMARIVTNPDTQEEIKRSDLAILGINTLLDYMALTSKLEFTSLVAYSSQYKLLSAFTRDIESIKCNLTLLENQDKTNLEAALKFVRLLLLDEWGAGTPCQVVLVTDGSTGIGKMSLQNSLNNYAKRDPNGVDDTFPLPFPMPCKLNIMCIANPNEPGMQTGSLLLQKLIEINKGEGQIYFPDGPLCQKSVNQMFTKLAEISYSSFHGTLRCGNLNSHVQLSPPPEPYVQVRDFEVVKKSVSSEIVICGFLHMTDVSSPAARSRHLVLPLSATKGESVQPAKLDISGEEEESMGDEGKVPSFCVLLHGSLKVESMVALCNLGDDWYGMLYSWADSKKKSNLMLTVFEPGSDIIPWMGNFTHLTSLSEFKEMPYKDDQSPFPIRPADKRSYAQNSVVWIRNYGLHADIQKILRHARKLPDKTQNFYKELNRLRKAALSFGFLELLYGMASVLERECTLLPDGTHPDAAIQLSHASNALRTPLYHALANNIIPFPSHFNSGK